MMDPLNLKNFDFQLPESLIAQKPIDVRDQSKLMVLDRKSGSIKHDMFYNLPNLIPTQSLMVFNNTKVIPSKLIGYQIKNSRPIKVLLLRETTEKNRWEALIKGLGKIKLGSEIDFGNGKLKAVLEGRNENKALLKLKYDGKLENILNLIGKMPLPPYIRRKEEDSHLSDQDRKRYQTIFASLPGAIAAPTAGLHFTPNIIKSLNKLGIDTTCLTLHVGVGTFQPIRVENITKHKMQSEQFYISKETSKAIFNARKDLKKIVGVGSTVTRVLESVEFEGLKPSDISGWTDLFIYPGRKFRNVDHLLTNFHLPKSTLYLLVCTFAGGKLIKEAYREAITNKYRFFSYGDAMLII